MSRPAASGGPYFLITSPDSFSRMIQVLDDDDRDGSSGQRAMIAQRQWSVKNDGTL